MDKLKKFLLIPVVFHVAIFATMIYMIVTKNNALGTFMLLDLCGVVISPVFYAVMSMIHAVIHEGKVYDYIYHCLIYLVLIGLVRVAIYWASAPTTALVAAACILVSIGIFTLWDIIFAFTDHMMKKGPKRKR